MAEPQAPEQVDGLLEKIADTALDDDYYVVRSGPYEQSREFNTVLTGIVLAVFALLVAIAAIQTRSDRPATQRERETLISDIDARKALLAGRESTAARLRTQVDELTSSVVGFDAAYEEMRLLASASPATGPGLRVTVSPGPGPRGEVTDSDLQVLVNAFWYAGAEAVSVNGKRIGSLTSVHEAGGTIKVNYQPIGPPFELVVLGDSDALEERFEQTAVRRDWLTREKNSGVLFDVTGSDDLSVEATPKARLAIKHANAIKEGDA